MGRGRGKGKKQAADDARESGEEEKPLVKRRGRPQKPRKDDTDGEEVENIEDDNEESERAEGSTLKNDTTVVENGRKRKKPPQITEKADSAKKENVAGTNAMSNNSPNFVGFRQNGSRRKNKPRRAAEVGVDC